jgi:hypothetical protein
MANRIVNSLMWVGLLIIGIILFILLDWLDWQVGNAVKMFMR